MVKNNNHRKDIDYFLHADYLICDDPNEKKSKKELDKGLKEFKKNLSNKELREKFEEFVLGLHNEELETFIARLGNTYFSYRMSYDKFQALLIGIFIATIMTITPLLIDLWVNYNSKIFTGILLIILISNIFLLRFLLKFDLSKKRSNNLKEKIGIVDEVILRRLFN